MSSYDRSIQIYSRNLQVWPQLAVATQLAPLVNAFKEGLDKHWKEYCFTLDLDEKRKGLVGLMSRAEDKGKG